MNGLFRPASAALLALAVALLGGCHGAESLLVVNESTSTVKVTGRHIAESKDAAVAKPEFDARIDPTFSANWRIPRASPGFVDAVRITVQPPKGEPEVIDLAQSGAFILRIRGDGGVITLKLEEQSGPAQADSSERQRREIIDRPPQVFGR